MKLLICYSTRPEYLKVKPIIEAAKGKVNFSTLWVGQHTDICDFGKPDFFIELKPIQGLDRLNNIASEIFRRAPEIINDFTHVLVQGDTSGVLNVALAAKWLKKEVIMVESGLRSFNKKSPFPEELNRILVSHIADYHFCPTNVSVSNLKPEGIVKNVFQVGNTVLDNLKDVESYYGDKVLCTIHRAENVPIIEKIFKKLDEVAAQYPELEFVIPLHPNPRILAASEMFKNVTPLSALEHKELIEIMRQSRFIITDSGGCAEESSFLKKKCIVLREYTERPEGIESGHFILCPKISELDLKVKEVYNNYMIDETSPFGDGLAAERIIEILKTIKYV